MPRCITSPDRFNACRVPGETKDCVRLYPPAGNHHVLVVRKNRYFVVHVTNSDGEPMPIGEIQSQLQVTKLAAVVWSSVMVEYRQRECNLLGFCDICSYGMGSEGAVTPLCPSRFPSGLSQNINNTEVLLSQTIVGDSMVRMPADFSPRRPFGINGNLAVGISSMTP